MSDIATGDKEDLKDRNINNTFKQIASNYANFCRSSLASIKAYYNKLYANRERSYHTTKQKRCLGHSKNLKILWVRRMSGN